jgi:hypothetical protein
MQTISTNAAAMPSIVIERFVNILFSPFKLSGSLPPKLWLLQPGAS